ncbi:MAG: hypothetical protein JW910_16295 [Anaerolineae bacterium]|nr:hypothetical protein [Anaerolineae bacterium]
MAHPFGSGGPTKAYYTTQWENLHERRGGLANDFLASGKLCLHRMAICHLYRAGLRSARWSGRIRMADDGHIFISYARKEPIRLAAADHRKDM